MFQSADLPSNVGELEKQICTQELKDLLKRVTDSAERQCLRTAIETKGQTLTDLQNKVQQLKKESEGPQCSDRPRKPTDKMLALQQGGAAKKVKGFNHMYEQWKSQACKARKQLKSDITEDQTRVSY